MSAITRSRTAVVAFVFTRFRQADGTTTRAHGGLGLGLSIVASLVRLQGGEVTVASAGSGKGATFTVRLPLASEGAPVPSAAPSLVTAGSSNALLAGVCVLMIDDDADMRSAVSLLLQQMGARVVALDSGRGIESALEAHRPDVLVLDISMPAEDGYALIRRIRKLPASAGGDVPAISLTAHARTEDRARAFSAGFQRHLPKPIDVPSLVTAIQELCMEPRAKAAEA